VCHLFNEINGLERILKGLTIENISMRFDLANGQSIQALKDVSLDIKEGQIISVLGPSGCGKTTLLNIVAGFLAPTEGCVNLNDQTVTGPSAERGMVFQQGALFEWMNVRSNVAFGPKMKKMPKPEQDKKVQHLLEVVGLGGFEDKAVYELSGGMQQRVALARCLANDPDVILMDEPLGALDALTREKMQGLVLKLWKETGKTIILITHSVEEAILLGERLLVLAPRPGRIHREYQLPYAEMGVTMDLREVKKTQGYTETREEILAMIWDMEEEIMGGVGEE
jgi:taurine transport system ATP-binding protein